MAASTLRIIIPGKPKSWKRTGGSGKRRFDVQKTAKGVIQVHAIQAIKGLGYPWPLSWLYQVRINAYWPLATSKYRKREPIPVAPRPIGADWDNLGKLVGDALEGICWENDRQIGRSPRPSASWCSPAARSSRSRGSRKTRTGEV